MYFALIWNKRKELCSLISVNMHGCSSYAHKVQKYNMHLQTSMENHQFQVKIR